MTKAGGVGALLQIADHASGKTFLPCYNGNGDVVALVNGDTGALAACYEYSPFGEPLRAESPDATVADQPFRFSTHFYDTETGLTYFGKRYYSASQGRFLGRDPKKEKGGLNLYGFCGNDSINFWDVLGEYYKMIEDDKNITFIVPVLVQNGATSDVALQMVGDMVNQWKGDFGGKKVSTQIQILTEAPKDSLEYNILKIVDGNGRSNVSVTNGITAMELFTKNLNGQANQANMPAHELGHVFGFEDRYRDVYKNSKTGQVVKSFQGRDKPTGSDWAFQGSEAIDGFQNRIMGNSAANVGSAEIADLVSGSRISTRRTTTGHDDFAEYDGRDAVNGFSDYVLPPAINRGSPGWGLTLTFTPWTPDPDDDDSLDRLSAANRIDALAILNAIKSKNKL